MDNITSVIGELSLIQRLRKATTVLEHLLGSGIITHEKLNG